MLRIFVYFVCFKMYIKVILILIGICRIDNSGIFFWYLMCFKLINIVNGKIFWYGKLIYVCIKYKEFDIIYIFYFIN